MRKLLVLTVLAVCALMMVPGALAGGLPKGENAKKYSYISGDFSGARTQGEWNWGGSHWVAYGGPITIYHIPIPKAGFGWGYNNDVNPSYLTWSTHEQSFMMGKGRAKNGAPLHWAPRELAVGTYKVPGDVIIGVSFYIQLRGWAENGSVWLTAGLYTHLHPLPSGTYVYVTVTDTQVILHGENIPFTYHDWAHEGIDDPPVNYGSTLHTFSFAMDK